jgi:DNA-binding transcriptional ArsR family regulator
MANEARVLNALGDPTRRQVFELLANGERHVAAITKELPVTQSAVSQHLKVLKDAGLIADRAQGTRRLYRIERNGLEALRSYVDRFWDDVLGSFTAFVDSETASPPPSVPKPNRRETTEVPRLGAPKRDQRNSTIPAKRRRAKP